MLKLEISRDSQPAKTMKMHFDNGEELEKRGRNNTTMIVFARFSVRSDAELGKIEAALKKCLKKVATARHAEPLRMEMQTNLGSEDLTFVSMREPGSRPKPETRGARAAAGSASFYSHSPMPRPKPKPVIRPTGPATYGRAGPGRDAARNAKAKLEVHRNAGDLDLEEAFSKASGSRPSIVISADDDEQLLRFPEEGPGAVAVFKSDEVKLSDGEFLNDTIIEFALKYIHVQLEQDLDPDTRATADQIFVCSSFFYKRLTNVKAKQDKMDGYRQVQKWTKGDIVLRKKYIAVPINEHLHWYLAIIVNPAYILNARLVPAVEGSEAKVKDEEPASPQDGAATAADKLSPARQTPPSSNREKDGERSRHFVADSQDGQSPEQGGDTSVTETEAPSVVGARTRQSSAQSEPKFDPRISATGEAMRRMSVSSPAEQEDQEMDELEGEDSVPSAPEDVVMQLGHADSSSIAGSRRASLRSAAGQGSPSKKASTAPAPAEEDAALDDAIKASPAHPMIADDRPKVSASDSQEEVDELAEDDDEVAATTEELRPKAPTPEVDFDNVLAPESEEKSDEQVDSLANAGRGKLVGGGGMVPGQALLRHEESIRLSLSPAAPEPAREPEPEPTPEPTAEPAANPVPADNKAEDEAAAAETDTTVKDSAKEEDAAEPAKEEEAVHIIDDEEHDDHDDSNTSARAQRAARRSQDSVVMERTASGLAMEKTKSTDTASDAPKPVKESTRQIKAREKLQQQERPVVITFDSLRKGGGSGHIKVARELSFWLRCEAEKKANIAVDESFVCDYIEAAIPQQPNYSDCGLYVIHFFERFASNPNKALVELVSFNRSGLARTCL